MKRYICIILLVVIALLSLSSCRKKCSYCFGRGTIVCEKCDGRGLRLCTACYFYGNGKCDECGGDGCENRERTCSSCGGDGIFINPYNWEQYLICSTCSGTGDEKYQYDSCWDCNSTGVCQSCKGTGLYKSKEETCEDCNGERRVDCSHCKNGYVKRS